MSGSEEGEVSGRDTILRRRAALCNTENEVSFRVPTSRRSYDPLLNVRLYPYGEEGWHICMLPRTAKTNEGE